MPLIHTKMLHHFDMTLHIHHAKRYGLQKKGEEYIHAQSMKKKER